MVQSLNLVGAGRVGQTLAHLWLQRRVFALQDVLTASHAGAQSACRALGAGQAVAALGAMRAAEVWMLAVPDAQIASTAHAMAQQLRERPPGLVFHCSGALDSSVLAPLADLGWHCASAHCLLSFTSVPSALAQFAGTPCALEGDAPARALLETAYATIGARCFTLAAADKRLYHAAAVFATNFVPVLYSVAEDLWARTGLPTELVPALRAALLRNTLANITLLGPRGALTGPAARGDHSAIALQAQALRAWDASSADAYDALSALALRLAGHTPPPR